MSAALVTTGDVTILYARLSKEDRTGDKKRAGVESCGVQVANGRAFAERQGWRADIVEIVDDGVSGAEIHEREGVQRILEVVRTRSPRRLVFRDLDRLARDPLWQAWLLAELDRVGCEAWAYSTGDRVEVRGPGYALTALKGVMAEGERLQASKRIREALRFRAVNGRAVGAPRFGYRVTTDEATSAKRWTIDADQAATIVRVGEAFVESGGSIRGAAIALNEAGVPSVGGKTWCHQSVRNILKDPLYRGTLVHGETRTVAKGGTLVKEAAPASDVLRVDHPELVIWPAPLLAKIDALLAAIKPRHRSQGARGTHLGSSMLRCAVCGSGMTVSGSDVGGRSYVCTRALQHGRLGCVGVGYRSESRVNEALARIAASCMTGRIAALAVEKIRKRMTAMASSDGREAERKRVARELAGAEQEKTNLARAIAKRGDLDALLTALDEATKRAADLRGTLARLDSAPVALDPRRRIAEVEARLASLADNLDDRTVLAAALSGTRLTATPVRVDGQKRWRLTGEISTGYVMALVGAASAPGGTPNSGQGPSALWPELGSETIAVDEVA